MDPISSLPLGLGASLRNGGVLPPLMETPGVLPNLPADFAKAIPSVGGAAQGRGFDTVLRDLVSDVNAKQLEAGKNAKALLAGEEIPLHRVMIASEEASVSFQLMVEVRNKLMEAYQELMRMQV